MSSDPTAPRPGARLRLASPDDILEWSSGEVTKPDTLHPRSGKPVPGGLFCEKIFGPLQEWRCRCGHLTARSENRRTCPRCRTPVLRRRGRRRRTGHVELASPVAHLWFVKARPCPIALLLDLRPGDVERVVHGEAYLVLEGDRTGEVVERHEAEGDADFPGRTGAPALEEALERLDLDGLDARLREQLAALKGSPESARRQEVLRRLRLVNTFRRSGVRPHWMILRRLPVIGPALRPMVRLDSGRRASSELNDLYARVVARNNRLRELLNQPTPVSILRIEQRQLQLAVDALLDNARCAQPILGPRRRELRSLSDLLGSKQGRFRGNLLGKRVDYSARSVIVVGPELKLHEVGLPHAIALRLFEPHLLGQLRREGWARTLRRGRRLLADLLHPERLVGAARRIVRELVRLRDVERAQGREDAGSKALAEELDTPEARARGRVVLDELAPSAIKTLRDSLTAQGRRAARERAHQFLKARQGRLWNLVWRVIAGHPVLLNRAPTLHRMGIQAFEPVLVEGSAIRLHPLVCKAFNADFDGDQMAVHLPLGEEAIAEAHARMTPAANLFNPASGQPIIAPGQDIVLGCSYLTTLLPRPAARPDRQAEDRPPPPVQFTPPPTDQGGGRTFATTDEVRLAHELGKLGTHARIALRLPGGLLIEEQDDQHARALRPGERVETTAGRALFNAALPAGLPYYNLTMTARRLARVLADCHRKFGCRAAVDALERIKALGFDAATRSGVSFATDDIPLPRNKPAVLREAFARVDALKRGFAEGNIAAPDYPGHLLDAWDSAHKRITGTLMPDLRQDCRAGRPYLNPLCVMADSGARGSPEQIRQLAGLRGLMASVSGRVIERPITASLREGLPSWDYFVSAYGGRKGLTDKGVRTAEAGYLTRKLVDAAQQVIVTQEDCGSLLGMLKRAPVGTLGGRVIGRVSLREVKEGGETILDAGELISPGQARRLAEMGLTELRVRSPLTCRAPSGVCRRCYGTDLSTGRLVEIGTAVGVIAAQSIGEPGTQLTLKVFQIGGVAGRDIVHDLDRVTRLLEVSPVDDPVPLAPVPAEVRIERYAPGQPVAPHRGWWLDDTGVDDILRLGGREIRVKHGERVEAGTALCEGEADLRAMLALGGSVLVGDFILEQVRRIYRTHRLDIDDRHFEVILSRMLGSVIVRDPGDTDLLPGEVLPRQALLAINRGLGAGKRPAYARTWLLGVSQAAARAEGFLAAASFQRAVKVLGEAALAGRRDALAGLKENVILGRAIPAGTGLEQAR